MRRASAKEPKSSCTPITGILAFLLLVVGGILPAIAQDAKPQQEPQGVLSGPVEGMGKNRKIMPLPKLQIDPARASPDATPAERPLRPFSGWVGPRGCRFPFDGALEERARRNRSSHL